MARRVGRACTRMTRRRSTTRTGRRSRPAAHDARVVAIGETGLDYDRVFSPIPDQLTNLRRNLALALETGKPAILHCRSAAGRRDGQDALLDELRAAGVGGGTWAATFGDRPPAVIHSFSGPVDYARAVLDLGLAISFSGLAFRAGEDASREVAAFVPAGAAARRDQFAVPRPARRAPLAQRAGVGEGDRCLGRRSARRGPRRRSARHSSAPTTEPSRGRAPAHEASATCHAPASRNPPPRTAPRRGLPYGRVMPTGWTERDERQFERVKASYLARGRPRARPRNSRHAS